MPFFQVRKYPETLLLDGVREYDIIEALEASEREGFINFTSADKDTGKGHVITDKGIAFVSDR